MKYIVLALFVVGLITSFWLLKLIFHGFYVKKNYAKVTAKILNYQISENFLQNPNTPVSNPRKFYELHLQYEYEINGEKYQSNQLNVFQKVHADNSATLHDLLPNPNGNGERFLTVYVNLKNPNQAYALPTHWNKWTYSVIAFLVITFTIFFGFLATFEN